MFHFILFLFINMEAACHSQQPPCWTAAAAFHLEWVMTGSGCTCGSWQAAPRGPVCSAAPFRCKCPAPSSVQMGASAPCSFKQNQNGDLSNCGSQSLTLSVAEYKV